MIGEILYSIELWEKITGKKAPRKYVRNDFKFFRSSNSKITKKDYNWLMGIEKEIMAWHPEEKGYTMTSGKWFGHFFEVKKK